MKDRKQCSAIARLSGRQCRRTKLDADGRCYQHPLGATNNVVDLTTRKDTARAMKLESDVMFARRAGLSYRQISKRLGVALATVHLAAKRAFKRLHAELLEDARDTLLLELQRLDEAQQAIWPDVLIGNLQAIDRVLRIIDRRAALLGLSTKSVTVTVTTRAEAFEEARGLPAAEKAQRFKQLVGGDSG